MRQPHRLGQPEQADPSAVLALLGGENSFHRSDREVYFVHESGREHLTLGGQLLIQIEALPHVVVLFVSWATFALTVWALVVTLRTKYARRYEKVTLTIILIVVPLLGLAAWALAWFTRRRSAPTP